MNSKHKNDHCALFRVCQFCEKWAMASAFYGHNSGAHCDIIEANTFNKEGRSMLQPLLTETLHCAIAERVLILNSASDPCVLHLAQQISAGELLLTTDRGKELAMPLARQACFVYTPIKSHLARGDRCLLSPRETVSAHSSALYPGTPGKHVRKQVQGQRTALDFELTPTGATFLFHRKEKLIMRDAALAQPCVVMGLLFFPRGGSAQVTHSLAHALIEQGWGVTVVSGSLGLPGRPGDARTFFRNLDLHPMDYTAALETGDPLCADPPLHPSYEERPGAPDRVFATVDGPTYEHLVASCPRALRQAGAATADILHLHHLTPLNEAAARIAPDVPVVGHLHGTELLLLEALASSPPVHWVHAEVWAQRMRRWASACQWLVVSPATQLTRAQALLGDAPRHYSH